MLLALIACLLVASSIGQLAKHLPSAGSIFTYPAEAIHPALGFLVGWGYALVEALLGPITTVLCGYLVGSIANSEWHWPFKTTWVMIAIYMVFNLSCIFYYLRRQRSEFNVLFGNSWGGMLAMQDVLDRRPDLESLTLCGSPASRIRWVADCEELLADEPLETWDIMDWLGEIEVPTLLVGGRYDECTPSHLAAMDQRIRGSQLRIIEDASHLCFAEQPAEFATAVNSFFDLTDRGSGL